MARYINILVTLIAVAVLLLALLPAVGAGAIFEDDRPCPSYCRRQDCPKCPTSYDTATCTSHAPKDPITLGVGDVVYYAIVAGCAAMWLRLLMKDPELLVPTVTVTFVLYSLTFPASHGSKFNGRFVVE